VPGTVMAIVAVEATLASDAAVNIVTTVVAGGSASRASTSSGRVVTCVRGQSCGERQVVGSTPVRTAVRTAASPDPRSGSLVPGAASLTAVDPYVNAAVPTKQELQGRPAGGGDRRQPARQPCLGMESPRAQVSLGELVGGHPGPLPPGRRR
jgi:hypothetical protein